MISFIFCIHNHQPVGNFNFVIEDACKNAYLPFLKTLSNYPSIKLSLHISGHLLDYLIENHREYTALLGTMIERGQVEMLGGGYYEPVLIAVPEIDRVGQIKLMSDKLYEAFGSRPCGIWLTERVWEPHLPKSLHTAGVDYVVVDDYHFVKAGLKRDALSGYYLTEEEGRPLKVFPGSEVLRYLIPFERHEKFIEHMKGLEQNLPHDLHRSKLIVFADDGEKFGTWPNTHKWVYVDGWLERFLEALKENLDWIRPVTFSEYIMDNSPLGRVYLPTTSYMEMGEWSLPAEASLEYANLVNNVKTWQDGERIRRFLQGGMWRSFMAKYNEANWMHKRMLMVSKKIQRNGETEMGRNGEKDSPISRFPDSPIHLLYKAQCNDAYWHGVFGGLYLPHLRSAVYENLIKAENLLEGHEQGGCPVFREADIDADNKNEIIIKHPALNIFLKPHSGGRIQELDFKPVPYNLTNVLTRRYEGYHDKIKGVETGKGRSAAKSIHKQIGTKEEGLEYALCYDNYERASLIDRFAMPQTAVDSFLAGDFHDCGDFVNADYTYEINKSLGEVLLSYLGRVSNQPVMLKKRIRPAQKSCVSIIFQITNMDNSPLYTTFLSEWNILISFGMKRQSLGIMEEFAIQEDWLGLKFNMQFNPAASIYIYPVETVSLSEAGFEKNFQGLCLLPSWELKLDSGETCNIEVLVDVSKLSV